MDRQARLAPGAVPERPQAGGVGAQDDIELHALHHGRDGVHHPRGDPIQVGEAERHQQTARRGLQPPARQAAAAKVAEGRTDQGVVRTGEDPRLARDQPCVIADGAPNRGVHQQPTGVGPVRQVVQHRHRASAEP